MNLSLLLTMPLVVALLSMPTNLYHAPVVTAAQKVRTAHLKKPAPVEYVCPMHADVKSKIRGTCPKCSMKLVKKRSVKSSGNVSTSD